MSNNENATIRRITDDEKEKEQAKAKAAEVAVDAATEVAKKAAVAAAAYFSGGATANPETSQAIEKAVEEAGKGVKKNVTKDSEKKQKELDRTASGENTTSGDMEAENDDTDASAKNDDSEDTGGENDDTDSGSESESGDLTNIESSDKKKDNIAQTMMKANLAAAAASKVAEMAIAAKLLAWFQMMLQMLMQLVQAIAIAVQAAIMAIVQTIVTIATTIATFLGIATAVALTGIVGFVVLVVLVVGSAVYDATNQDTIAKTDELVEDCETQIRSISTVYEGSDDEIQLEIAGLIYSFYSTYGLADTNIAGVLGNWDVESGLDPTSIETMSGIERYTIGDRKSGVVSRMSDFTQNEVFDAYARSGISLAKSAYQATDGKYYCGMGLGQWTGTRALLLLDFATNNSLLWYELDTQLAFSVTTTSSGGDSRSQWMSEWDPESSTEEAAVTFASKWEGNTIMAQDERATRAVKWRLLFAEMSIDADYANSVLALSEIAAHNAASDSVVRAARECESYDIGGNGSIAEAAVSYAYETRAEGNMNNGTELYQFLVECMPDFYGYYMSCDRGVATAVRWAGADDNMPMGGTSEQLRHLSTSSKWKEISWNGSMDVLQPGDVLINNGHIVLYVGHETVVKKYPNAPENVMFVSASLGNRSPGCVTYYKGYYDGVMYDYVVDGRPIGSWYRIFRNVETETNSIYINIAEGAGHLSNTTGTAYDSSKHSSQYATSNTDYDD